MSLFNDSNRSGNQPSHRTMSVGVRRLQEALNMHLDMTSKAHFVEALNQYHVSRDVPMFVRNLKQVLDTPAKKQIFALIRKVIPKMDIEEFDRHVQFNGKKFDTMPVKRSKKLMQRSRSPLPGGELSTIQPFKKQQKQRKMKDSKKKENDGKESDSSHSTQPTLTSKSSRSLKSAIKEKGTMIKKVRMKLSDPDKGFGFSIRGGSEFGLGIYVSIVDKGGMAESQGLRPGDLIMEANGVSFEKTSHNEAAKIIRSAKKLDLKLCRVGRIPGTFVVHQMYKWVDAYARPVSPPPELELIGQLDSLGRRSGFSLLKGTDERKINVTVQKGQGLGLMIRGGREFGLGIYISGVDPFSVADDNGLKVGDQILDINGESFLDITHAEAVKVLKLSTHMIMTIKDVGKLPYARTKIDETHWLNNTLPARRKINESQKSDSSAGTHQSSKNSMFRKGLGSQLMLNTSIHSKWDNIQEQASELLNETEQGTLRYYLSEYQRGYISVDGLVMASFELLNTKAKMTMMPEIRNWVRPRDLSKFNILLHRREAQQNKLFSASSLSLDGRRTKGFSRQRLRMSDRGMHTISAPASRSQSARERPGRLRRQASESELEPLRWAIQQIEDDPDFNSDFQDELEPFQSLRLRSLSSEHLATSNLHQTSLASRRSLSVETLTPVYIDTISDLPPSPRPSLNSALSMRPRSRSNSASRRHRPKDTYSHRQRSGSNSSTLRRRHKSLEDVRSPSPTQRRIRTPYPSGPNSEHDIRETLSSVSYTHLQDASSEYEFDSPVRSRSPKLTRAANVVYADVHQPPRTADGNPSDDSGVEVNGNHGNSQNRVTISADHPVDIDDVLERRSSLVSANINFINSKNSSLGSHNNGYKSNSSTLTNQKPSNKPRRSVQNVFNNHSRTQSNTLASGLTLSVRSDNRYPPEIRINDGEGSIDTMSIETPSSPNFVSQSRKSFVHQSYARSKRFNQSAQRNKYSPTSKYSDSDDDDNDDYDDETEIFETHSEMGDNSEFYVSPLDRVLDKEEVDEYSERSSIISYGFEEQKLSEARRKYGDIPLDIVQIYKTKPTLGMAIEGGANTRQPLPRVINLQPGGSAYESGGLKVGHVILEVNSRSMAGLEHIAAAKVIAEAFKSKTSDTMELLVTDSTVKDV